MASARRATCRRSPATCRPRTAPPRGTSSSASKNAARHNAKPTATEKRVRPARVHLVGGITNRAVPTGNEGRYPKGDDHDDRRRQRHHRQVPGGQVEIGPRRYGKADQAPNRDEQDELMNSRNAREPSSLNRLDRHAAAPVHAWRRDYAAVLTETLPIKRSNRNTNGLAVATNGLPCA